MPTRTALALCPALLLLTACGDYEDASAEAQADTVEIPANEPLGNVNAAPVADPGANTNIVEDPAATPDTGATATGTPTPGATPATATPTPTPTTTATATPSPTPQAARTPAPTQ